MWELLLWSAMRLSESSRMNHLKFMKVRATCYMYMHMYVHVHVPQKRALGSYNYFMQLLILSPVFQCSNIENLGIGLGTRLYMHAIPQILLISTMSHILLHYIHVHVHVHSMWHYTHKFSTCIQEIHASVSIPHLW